MNWIRESYAARVFLCSALIGSCVIACKISTSNSPDNLAGAETCDGIPCTNTQLDGLDGGQAIANDDSALAYVAIGSDFESFESWETFPLGDAPEPVGVHFAGPRTIYINKLPPKGSTEFPVGTIIVKAIKAGPSKAEWQMFAMVKRGGNFNSVGAVGWEWFGLEAFDNGTVKIEWRGWSPPADGGVGPYGGGGLVGVCNKCHLESYENDYVQSPPLQLKTFFQ